MSGLIALELGPVAHLELVDPPLNLFTGALVLDTVSLGTLCSDAGIVALERNRYSCSDDATVEVVDCDLNASSAAVESGKHPDARALRRLGIDPERFRQIGRF